MQRSRHPGLQGPGSSTRQGLEQPSLLACGHTWPSSPLPGAGLLHHCLVEPQLYSWTVGIWSRVENRGNAKWIWVSHRTLGISTHPKQILKTTKASLLQTGLQLVHQGNVCTDCWHRSAHSVWSKSSQGFMIRSLRSKNQNLTMVKGAEFPQGKGKTN